MLREWKKAFAELMQYDPREPFAKRFSRRGLLRDAVLGGIVMAMALLSVIVIKLLTF